jgi:hypothetical protein
MIFHFQPLVSWPFFFGFLSVMAAVGLVSLFLQWEKGVSPSRVGLRLFFFLGFIICLSLVILRPHRQIDASGSRILVYQRGIEKATIDFWKDSLKIKRAVVLSKFQPRSEEVFLFGDQFTLEQLFPFKDLDFEWILPERQGAVRELSWKGYLRKGEVQRLSFTIFSEEDSARLEIAGANLEQRTLKKGWNSGFLEFYPGGLGKAEFPLVLDKDTLTSVRFFIGASSPKKYHFQLGFPGAESRTLSNWLREKGEKVTEEIKLSRETVLQSGTTADSMQILLIDPAQLDQKSVQEAMKNTKTALVVMNVSQATETAKKLNRLFGTDFQPARSSQNEVRILENGIETLPFSFSEKPGQKLLQEKAIAIQYAGSNPIGMSLVSASYPLALQAKTEIYESLWGELFGLLEPDEEEAWRMEAPLLSGISREIQLLSQDSLPGQLAWNGDTLALKNSAVNSFLAKGNLQVKDSTWVELDSGFSVYAYGKDELQSLKTAALIQEMKESSDQKSMSESGAKRPISPWIWMVGMLLFLGLLWVEPKLQS